MTRAEDPDGTIWGRAYRECKSIGTKHKRLRVAIIRVRVDSLEGEQ